MAVLTQTEEPTYFNSFIFTTTNNGTLLPREEIEFIGPKGTVLHARRLLATFTGKEGIRYGFNQPVDQTNGHLLTESDELKLADPGSIRKLLLASAVLNVPRNVYISVGV